jgi:hypothetical protein
MLADLLDVGQVSPTLGIFAVHAGPRDFFQERVVVAQVLNMPLLR